MDSGSVASTAGDDERDASTTSCPRSDRAETAAPPTRPVPMTRIFTSPSSLLVGLAGRPADDTSRSAPRQWTPCAPGERLRLGRHREPRCCRPMLRGSGGALRVGTRALVLGQSNRHVGFDDGPSCSSKTFSEADQMARWKARCASCRATGSGRRPWPRTRARRGGGHPAIGCVIHDRRCQSIEGHPGLGEVADGGGVDLGDAQTRCSTVSRPSCASWASASRTVGRLTCRAVARATSVSFSRTQPDDAGGSG